MRFARLVTASALALSVAACAKEKERDETGAAAGTSVEGSATSPSATASPSSSPAGNLSGPIVVFAASSLTQSFEKLRGSFAAKYPGTAITFQFGSSATLATQIASGAPADVFAAASPATMKTVEDAGDAEAPATFVTNRLEIAVPAGNPGDVTGLGDFTKADLDIALCVEEAPCGSAAKKLFEAVQITPQPDTREQDVKRVLAKVELGEVDLALVYHTDVLSADPSKVEGITFPESGSALNSYPIAVLKDARNRAVAEAWVAFVQSEEGRRVLEDAGFEVP